MPDDVLLNKCEIVERCLKRIQEDYEGHESELSDDFMRQDAILLNIQRMCQASIDLAMHVVRVRALGLPRESRGAFELLKSAQLMDAELGYQARQTGLGWMISQSCLSSNEPKG